MSKATGIKSIVKAVIIVYYVDHGEKIEEATRIAEEHLREVEQQQIKEANEMSELKSQLRVMLGKATASGDDRDSEGEEYFDGKATAFAEAIELVEGLDKWA